MTSRARMALEIGSYSGDAAELGQFIVTCWRGVLSGKAWFPLWDQDFIAWKVMDPRILNRDLVIEARQDGRLIGCLVAVPMQFRMGDQDIPGSIASFLSVDPSYRRPGLGFRMADEARRRHKVLGLQLSLGVHDARPGAVAAKFWAGIGARNPAEFQMLRRITIWTHVFDGRAVARASLSKWQALESRLGGYLPLGWNGRAGAGKPADPGELDTDLATLRAGLRPEGLSVVHSRETLDHAMHHPYCMSFRHPAADAIVAGYMIDWCGRADLRVGFIDLVAGTAPSKDMAALLIHAAHAMRARGAQMAVMMDQGAGPRSAFWRAGFVPVDSEVDAFAWMKDSSLELPQDLRLSVPFT
jgi:hypothetical protein